MIKNIQSIRGMKDYMIYETIIFQKIEKILKKILFNYGYNEIRFPILENADLFKNAIGSINDVVEKEMFTFNSKKGNLLTLRPEGTAGCIRAAINHDIFKKNKNQRLWYIGPMFRYERPQKGRYRQFYQLGVEAFGLFGPNIDLELILISTKFWKKLNIHKYLKLHINSIGSYKDRMNYQNKLINFLEKNQKILNENCKRRLYTNTLRILDSKDSNIQELLKKAPKIYDYIDAYSREHFIKLCKMLDNFGIKYYINHNLIRGLDYYNNTVFEWKTSKLGSQDAICAGGRYDCLIKKLGGSSTPGIGFAIGIDRLLILIKTFLNKKLLNIQNYIDLYIIFDNQKIEIQSILLTENIREKCKNSKIIIDYNNLNIKKIFSIANKNSARFLLFIEENSFKKEKFFLKDLEKGYEYFLSKNDLLKKLPIFLKN